MQSFLRLRAFARTGTPRHGTGGAGGDQPARRSMLLGNLPTAVWEKLPIKAIVYNNGSLGFVEMGQKVEGLRDAFTGLKNRDLPRWLARWAFTDDAQITPTAWKLPSEMCWPPQSGAARRQAQSLRAGDTAEGGNGAGAAYIAVFGQAILAGRSKNLEELARTHYLD